MSSQQYSPLVEHVLSHVTLDRLAKATMALAHGDYTIRFTTRSDSEIGAYVTNGDGVEYAVSLTTGRAFCSCKDSMFRQTVCKHTVAVALQTVRTPAEQQPITHLMRQNTGSVVCGEKYPQKLLCWPWPETIVNNRTQWPEITICPDCIRNRYPMDHSTDERAPDLRLGKVRPTFDAAT